MAFPLRVRTSFAIFAISAGRLDFPEELVLDETVTGFAVEAVDKLCLLNSLLHFYLVNAAELGYDFLVLIGGMCFDCIFAGFDFPCRLYPPFVGRFHC